MDGRLALYSGAVFAGVLVAGGLVLNPGFGSSESGSSNVAPAAATSTASGFPDVSTGFVASIGSVSHGDDHKDTREHGEDDD